MRVLSTFLDGSTFTLSSVLHHMLLVSLIFNGSAQLKLEVAYIQQLKHLGSLADKLLLYGFE